MTNEQLIALFRANAEALKQITIRIDKMDRQIDHLVNQFDDHFEIEWATKRDYELLRIEVMHMRRDIDMSQDIVLRSTA